MAFAAIFFGCFLYAGVLLDAFQTIILPRRPVGRFRITKVFFLATWGPWRALTGLVPKRKREQLYSIYGPLSLLLLFAVWAGLLVSAFAFLDFGLGIPFNDPFHPTLELAKLRTCFYVSGTTLFTLGLGDIVPGTTLARFITVIEAGTGLGFVALVIGYLPVLYSSFSHREISVALLDARAGSPPTATELLLRHSFNGGHHALTELLAEWERWCAEMLETHISYPILCYYRSQHDNQSWLSALTAVLDTCALLITTIEGPSTRQAQLTFAIGRHVLVDLGHVFQREQSEQAIARAPCPRLPNDEFARMCDTLGGLGFSLCSDREVPERLAAIRKLYEPHALALAHYLHLDLPLWAALPPDPAKKPNVWTSVANLRHPSALTERLSSHVSTASTASNLEDRDAHRL